MYGYEKFDRISYLMGFIECFCEMVHAKVKRLALSPILTPEEAKILLPAVKELCKYFDIEYTEEPQLLRNLLVDDSKLDGKIVYLLYDDPQLMPEYNALKKRESEAKANGTYTDAVRAELNDGLCRLLSYPEGGETQLYKDK